MKIIALGETTYDITFKDDKPVDARVGGSIVNTSISLGRLGLPVSLVASCGSDEIGTITSKFLQDNNINTTLLTVYEGTSRVALAFLDERNNAHYSFYNGNQYDYKPLVFPFNEESWMVIYGSSFGIRTDIRTSILHFLKLSHSQGSILFYDPNVRPAQLAGNDDAKDWIIENIALSDIVKGSDEDFKLLFNTSSPEEAYTAIKSINPDVVLIVTANKHGADLFTPSLHIHVNAPPITPINTIGAGDSFSAGIIFGLHESKTNLDNLQNLSEERWDIILGYAIKFATEVCLSNDNYIKVSRKS